MPPWNSPAGVSDAEARGAWSASGAQWLTDPGVGVPARLVRSVLGLVSYLDARGARLATELPGGGLGLLAERAAVMGLAPASGRVSCGGATRLVQAADGWLAVSLARDSDVELLPAWLAPAAVPWDGDPWEQITLAARAWPASARSHQRATHLTIDQVG